MAFVASYHRRCGQLAARPFRLGTHDSRLYIIVTAKRHMPFSSTYDQNNLRVNRIGAVTP